MRERFYSYMAVFLLSQRDQLNFIFLCESFI